MGKNTQEKNIEELLNSLIEETIGLSSEFQVKLLTSVIVVLLLWLTRRLVLNILRRLYQQNIRTHYQSRKASGYIIFVTGLFLIGWIWLEGVTSLVTFLGLASAGLVIALKDLLIDLAGWFFIVWRQPFVVGDRIQLGEFSGDVIDIRPFQFTLLEIGNWVYADQSTGRVIHIPNGQVFKEPQASYTQGFQYLWDELPVMITFESNWRKAKDILLEIAMTHVGHLSDSARANVEQAAQRYLIFYSKLTPIVYTSVVQSGVLLTIRYLSEPRRRRGNAQAIWEDVLQRFAECDDIAFAYPTQRFYVAPSEQTPPRSPSLDL